MFDYVTDLPYYDGLIKNPRYYLEAKGIEFVIVAMPPRDYLKLVAEMQNTSMEKQREMAHRPSLNWFEQQISEGKKLPLPLLDYASQGQEGRARAVFMEQLGKKLMPVMIVYKSDKVPSIAK